MKILFFAHYLPDTNNNGGYNGGGWVSSLIEGLLNIQGIEIAVAFFERSSSEKPLIVNPRLSIYPMKTPEKSLMDRVRGQIQVWNYKTEENSIKAHIVKMKQLVEEVKPDVIQVFGTEKYYGHIADEVNVPVFIHIQGILNPYLNAYLPPFISLRSYYLQDYNIKKIHSRFMNIVFWRRDCLSELQILMKGKLYIGRTEWDKRVVSIFNQNAIYNYGSEILRPVFYKASQRNPNSHLTIVSTISSPLYKGMDLVLKTAYSLKNNLGLEFDWKIFGLNEFRFVEKTCGIKAKDVNIVICGVATAAGLREELLGASVYVHPSYIDNSPNSLCEAQLLGIPVVATNVGGIPSLVKDGETGFLVPANDPFQTAYLLKRLQEDTELNITIGEQGKMVAEVRHNRERITNDLIELYKSYL